MNRRDILKVIGGGAILAAGGATAFTLTRTPTRALAPWDAPGGETDPRRAALSFAILAPNPHNRQPWLVDLSTPDTVILHVDRDRLLPVTDPFSRQITIGLGCFLGLMEMAAGAQGYAVETEVFPQGADAQALDARPVAVCRFSSGGARDPLFAHVLDRRSNKEVYDTARPVDPDALRPLIAAGATGGDVSDASITALRALTAAALMAELEDDPAFKESVDLFRIGKAEVEANPDGIDFTGPFFETLNLLGQFDRDVAMDRSHMAYTEGVRGQMEVVNSAMGHVWIVSDGNTRRDQIETGRRWLRVNLAATAQGLDIHPLSQALQEYPAVAPFHDQIHARLAAPGQTVQMLGRIGYGPAVPPSPRWAYETRIARG